jgi:hypothetical protein
MLQTADVVSRGGFAAPEGPGVNVVRKRAFAPTGSGNQSRGRVADHPGAMSPPSKRVLTEVSVAYRRDHQFIGGFIF